MASLSAAESGKPPSALNERPNTLNSADAEHAEDTQRVDVRTPKQRVDSSNFFPGGRRRRPPLASPPANCQRDQRDDDRGQQKLPVTPDKLARVIPVAGADSDVPLKTLETVRRILIRLFNPWHVGEVLSGLRAAF